MAGKKFSEQTVTKLRQIEVQLASADGTKSLFAHDLAAAEH